MICFKSGMIKSKSESVLKIMANSIIKKVILIQTNVTNFLFHKIYGYSFKNMIYKFYLKLACIEELRRHVLLEQIKYFQ